MSEMIQDDISFDTAYRLGKFKSNFRRPIRVRFLAMCQRNLIYANKNKLLPPFYINEDLPFSIRKDHAILRNKKKEALQNGSLLENISIDWKLRTITVDARKFSILNGNLIPSMQVSTSSNSSQHSTSTPADFLDPDVTGMDSL